MKLARFTIASSNPLLSLWWATPTARISQTSTATAATRLRHVRVYSCFPACPLASCTCFFPPFLSPYYRPLLILITHSPRPPFVSQLSRGFTNSATTSMPPTTKPSTGHYDYIIVGGGSGGSGSSVRFLVDPRTRSFSLFCMFVELLIFAPFCGLFWLTETCCDVWQEGRCDREHRCAWGVLRQSRYVVPVTLHLLDVIVTCSYCTGCVPKKVLQRPPRDH